MVLSARLLLGVAGKTGQCAAYQKGEAGIMMRVMDMLNKAVKYVLCAFTVMLVGCSTPASNIETSGKDSIVFAKSIAEKHKVLGDSFLRGAMLKDSGRDFSKDGVDCYLRELIVKSGSAIESDFRNYCKSRGGLLENGGCKKLDDERFLYFFYQLQHSRNVSNVDQGASMLMVCESNVDSAEQLLALARGSGYLLETDKEVKRKMAYEQEIQQKARYEYLRGLITVEGTALCDGKYPVGWSSGYVLNGKIKVASPLGGFSYHYIDSVFPCTE